jgi:Cys-tRNA(Pro) deacylase
MEKILEKEPVKRVKDTLIKSSIKTELLVLNSSARTAVDAASTLKCNVGAIVKSLLLKAEESFLICLVAGDKRCSLNKLKKILNKRDVRMANANEVKENTGFTIGGVSPVGHIKKLDILIDKSLSRFQNLFAAAGHPDCVFRINYKELVKITNGSVKEITE